MLGAPTEKIRNEPVVVDSVPRRGEGKVTPSRPRGGDDAAGGERVSLGPTKNPLSAARSLRFDGIAFNRPALASRHAIASKVPR